jgi:4-hydroxy-3-methylbut-2-enyl diphosphate reductase IspH
MEPFLPAGQLRIGLTSGASTPDRVVEGVIDRLLELAELQPDLEPDLGEVSPLLQQGP